MRTFSEQNNMAEWIVLILFIDANNNHLMNLGLDFENLDLQIALAMLYLCS